MREFRPVPKPVKQEKPVNKRIKPRSTKRVKQEREYAKLAKEYLASHLYCQAKLDGCMVVASEVHHRQGKIGNLLTDTTNFMAICRHCHNFITEHSKEAIEMGLSKSRLHKNTQL